MIEDLQKLAKELNELGVHPSGVGAATEEEFVSIVALVT